MRKYVFVLLCLLFAATGYAQGVLKGRLFDSTAKQALALATVTIFKAKDTTIVTYRLTDPDGNFKVPGLPANIPLRAVITSSGYKVFRREFEMTVNQQIDWGVVQMKTDTSELDEVLVYAERPPVSIKKDTIEFNASAFKTLPTALVEDLLKKLPGVEVDQDGNIRVNGRVVNRILVDGKDFFGGDPKVATRNLPANLIDKVQVADDKEQLDRNPDITKSDLGQVINLKLKKAIKQGWFGKAYAGGGSGSRTHYEGGGIVNSFRDTLQVSALAYTNNLNKAGFGFSDLEKLGGFGRSGYNSMSVWSDGGIAINGVSFGATGQGIQKSTGAGINISHDPNKNLKLNFQYFFGHINSDFESVNNTQQFFNDTTITTRNNTKDINDDFNHRFGLRLSWKLDSMSTLTFRPSFTIRNYHSNRDFNSVSFSNYQPLLNQNENAQEVDTKDLNYTQELSYTRNFKKKGRSFFVNSNFSWGNSISDQTNIAESIFYNGQSSTSDLNQLRNRDYDNLNVNASLTYNEPLTKNLSLRLTNTTSYFKDDDIYTTYDWDPLSGKYQTINADLSNGLDRSGVRNVAGAVFNRKWKKLTISPGIQAQWLDIDNLYQKTGNINQRFFYVLPTLNVNYGSFNGGYRVSVREPSASDLRPVIDNTNPMYQSLGNPNLVPTISHNMNLGFYKYDNKKQFTYNVYLNYSIEDDAIIRERVVDQKGVQVTRPINVDGVTRLNSSIFVSKQYKLINSWQFTLRPGFSFGYNKSFVIVNTNRSNLNSLNLYPSINFGFNWKDLFEITQRYSLNLNENKYESDSYRNTSVTAHYSTSEIVVRVPKNWVWETSLDYRYNPQVSPGISKNIVRWHAGINYLFLKEQKGQLKLYAYDLLNQNTNAFRSVNENYISDTEIKTLTRYFLLTFTYNIRDFKGGKVGGRQSMFFF